jgi:hypothetical protein
MQYSSYVFLNDGNTESISIKALVTVNLDNLSESEFLFKN